MKDRIAQDLANLYARYGQVLLDKAQLEVEIRIRQGILEVLRGEESAKEEAKDADA